jgi:hypothetical protein
MTDLPTYAEMMAVGDKRADAEREAEESDGFVVEEWSEDGDVWGCLGHVDKAKFLTQVQRRYAADGYTTSQDATVDQVQHRYMVMGMTDEDGEQRYHWSVLDESKPSMHGHAQARAVTADDPGAEPVTMLDL